MTTSSTHDAARFDYFPNLRDRLRGVEVPGAGLRLVNLTAEAVQITQAGETITVPASGLLAELAAYPGEPDYRGVSHAEVHLIGIPAHRDVACTYYIVSREVALFAAAHPDFSDEECFMYLDGRRADGTYRDMVLIHRAF